ncbi:MAG: hypothetical protein CL484_04965 [Acidobacteria bacterium]|nr:hypothetical protein [Acidobacteriota bacterium]
MEQPVILQRTTTNLIHILLPGLILGIAGCSSERSSNPLSPQIAGPIAGVTITTPSALDPPDGRLIAATEQPIVLSFESVTSNSPRPFTYQVEVAREPTFSQTRLSMDGIQPHDNSPVLVDLKESLEAEELYFWRVRAVDGANSSAYSEVVSFEVFSPVNIAQAVASEPSGGQETATNIPLLVANHAETSGPAEDVQYRFELATDPEFISPIAVLTSNPVLGTNPSVSPGELAHNQTFHWRVRASAKARNGQIIGPWSATASFRTPPPPITIGTPIPASPINGATTDSIRPTFTVTNGVVSGSAGTVTYRFEIDEGTSFGNPTTVMEVPRSGSSSTSATTTNTLQTDRHYFWRVNASNGSIMTEWSAPHSFRTPTAQTESPTTLPGSGPRTSDPAPGQKLPLPNEAALIAELAETHSAALANSCQEEGGTWEFMDLAVEKLRETDSRWGYNCKRGNCNDPSVDIVDYFYGIGDGNHSTDVYIIDIIQNHCSHGSENPAWYDLTDATRNNGTVGRWLYPRP